ncbi:MAG: hypothetical protein J6V41_03530 [Kiritimatiellae bacterium]|nr:hypothetical protein [Kiritimatiellia bacterium]
MNRNLTYISKVLLYILSFALFSTIALGIVYIDTVLYHNVLEGGITEKLQIFLILGCGSLYLLHSLLKNEFRLCNSLVAILFSLFFVRELDAFFDNVFFHGSWFYIVFVILCFTFLYYIRKRYEIVEEFVEYSKTTNFALLALGLVLLLVVSRFFGYKGIWKIMCSDLATMYDVNILYRPIKNLVEEGMEVVAYVVLLFSAVHLFFTNKEKKQ